MPIIQTGEGETDAIRMSELAPMPDDGASRDNRGGRPLRAGLFADAHAAASLAAALKRAAEIELTGVAGPARGAAPEAVAWYDDCRVMIARERLDILLVADSPLAGISVCDAALDVGVHVWRQPPLGRGFAEAIEVARRIQNAGGHYHIASWWEHVRDAILKVWRSVGEEAPVFSEVQISIDGPPLNSWRSSLVDAGGGVLINDAYDAVEGLCAMRGAPESVYGTIGKCRDRASATPRETEDMASVILKYDDGGAAHIRALWDCPPAINRTHHYGPESGVSYDGDSVTSLNSADRPNEAAPLPSDLLDAQIRTLIRDITTKPDSGADESSVERHLTASAVLEAAYLSAKTGQPEDPRRLFEARKWPMEAS